MRITPRAAELRATQSTREVAAAPERVAATRPRPQDAVASAGLSPQSDLDGALERIAGARGLDAALFRGSRPIDILEDVLVRLLPGLDLDQETRRLAVALLREEIDTRQALEVQRTEACTL